MRYRYIKQLKPLKLKLRIEELRTKYRHNQQLRIELYNEQVSIDKSKTEELDKETPIYRGKVRSLYKVIGDDNQLCIRTSDRLSGFDRHLCNVPFKGSVLTSISTWWFDALYEYVPHHFENIYCTNTVYTKKCDVIPIEFVVRGYMTGTTQTSIWQNYLKGVRSFCGNGLREGYNKNDKLDEVIITPTTKSNEHDLPISAKEIVEQEIMTKEDWDTCAKYAMTLFKVGQDICEKRGLILVDTKYEFGKDKDGNIMLIDEVHTPDSSRYWIKHSYDERHSEGEDPDNIDKEFIRKWVKKTYGDPYKEGLDIAIPDELVTEMSSRYLLLHELITGKELEIY
jgi:phosphoribosylaminoimidazole-succinocarboxamide synthase